MVVESFVPGRGNNTREEKKWDLPLEEERSPRSPSALCASQGEHAFGATSEGRWADWQCLNGAPEPLDHKTLGDSAQDHILTGDRTRGFTLLTCKMWRIWARWSPLHPPGLKSLLALKSKVVSDSNHCPYLLLVSFDNEWNLKKVLFKM